MEDAVEEAFREALPDRHVPLPVVSPALSPPPSPTLSPPTGSLPSTTAANTSKRRNKKTSKPSTAASNADDTDTPEFQTLEYTPCTTKSPIGMNDQLRVTRAGRRVKYAVGVTVDPDHGVDDVKTSLMSINSNIRALTASSHIDWTQVLVVIVIDGVDSLSKPLVEYLQKDLGVYDPSLVTPQFESAPVWMHLFERSIKVVPLAQAAEVYDPMQMLLGVKSHSGGHMHSRLWFLSGFCHHVRPLYATVMTAGVKPGRHALCKLVNVMARNKQVGCVTPDFGVERLQWYNPIHAAQHFVLKLAGVLSHPLGSLVGYIPALHEDFLTMRWAAVVGVPLGTYFTAEDQSLSEMGPFLSNRCLAPQHALALELSTKQNRAWTHHYASAADVSVPAPESLLEFLELSRQRYNGGLFSTVSYIMTAPRNICSRSGHSVLRKPGMVLQYLLRLVEFFGSWFTVASFYLAFILVAQTVLVDGDFALGTGCFYTLNLFILILTLSLVVAGLGTDIQDLRLIYWCTAVGFALLFVIMIIMMLYMMGNGVVHEAYDALVAATVTVIIALFVLHGQLYSGVITFAQFMLCIPVFVVMIPVYAITNMDNVSLSRSVDVHNWDPATHTNIISERLDLHSPSGRQVEKSRLRSIRHMLLDGDTRGATEAMNDVVNAEASKALADDQSRRQRVHMVARRFAAFRTRTLGLWLVSSWLWVTFWLYFGVEDSLPYWLVGYVAFMALPRIVASCVYLIVSYWQCIFRILGCCYRDPNQMDKRRCGCCLMKPRLEDDDDADNPDLKPTWTLDMPAPTARVVPATATRRPVSPRAPSRQHELDKTAAARKASRAASRAADRAGGDRGDGTGTPSAVDAGLRTTSRAAVSRSGSRLKKGDDNPDAGGHHHHQHRKTSERRPGTSAVSGARERERERDKHRRATRQESRRLEADPATEDHHQHHHQRRIGTSAGRSNGGGGGGGGGGGRGRDRPTTSPTKRRQHSATHSPYAGRHDGPPVHGHFSPPPQSEYDAGVGVGLDQMHASSRHSMRNTLGSSRAASRTGSRAGSRQGSRRGGIDTNSDSSLRDRHVGGDQQQRRLAHRGIPLAPVSPPRDYENVFRRADSDELTSPTRAAVRAASFAIRTTAVPGERAHPHDPHY